MVGIRDLTLGVVVAGLLSYMSGDLVGYESVIVVGWEEP